MQSIDYWQKRSINYNNLKWVQKGNMIEDMVAFAGEIRNKRLLDLGTGTGKVLDVFKKHFPSCEFHGIDISPDMIKSIAADKDYIIRQCSMENIQGYEDEFFDAVTARMVLHHSCDIVRVYNEVKRVLKPSGVFIVCEGTPPSIETVEFYKEMFRYKEERHTFLVDDLVNFFINNGYSNVCAKISVIEGMSLNNWLTNSGVPEENVEIIRDMHFNAPETVKDAYSMKITGDDILMNWKFAVVCGEKA